MAKTVEEVVLEMTGGILLESDLVATLNDLATPWSAGLLRELVILEKATHGQ